ncbi:MAG: NADH-quinone oxidoreductase subunit J [Verrucomicrobiota bacterium]|nr:NADH-quinone oxidoreductase subunit J [Limisphaera sp.]MDW8382488.1 NADH-quinone oxidoreductase subunit J [Verrucomicrobiota bacterium]
MSLPDLLFYVFAAAALLSGALVVWNPFSRNPVYSALFLAVTILALSGLFVLLHAYFVAAVQVLVYAGAVMVLFLFVLMLLDLREEARRRLRWAGLLIGVLAAGGVTALLLRALWWTQPGRELAAAQMEGTVRLLGRLLFTHYLLPLEMMGLLLLVAMVGVIVLSKRDVP